jgi:hypothetical protein
MTRTETALVPAGEAGVTYSLDNWPEDKFNRLIPVQRIWMPGDLFIPVVNPVVMDPADREGKSLDHYSSKDVPAGRRALTARGLSKVATAASLSFYDERRLDDFHRRGAHTRGSRNLPPEPRWRANLRARELTGSVL